VESDLNEFSGKIRTAEDEVRSLCSHIEQKTLTEATAFKQLIGDAHLYCPHRTTMEPILENINIMAGKHTIAVKKQLGMCLELLRMLASGLESGDFVVHYLKEGNYSLATSTIDKWHESFTKLHATFYAASVPLESMLGNSKVFFHDRLSEGLGWFVFTWASIFLLSLMGPVIVRIVFVLSVRESGKLLVRHVAQSEGSKQTQEVRGKYTDAKKGKVVQETRTLSDECPIYAVSPEDHTVSRSNVDAPAMWLIQAAVFLFLTGAALVWMPGSSSLPTTVRHSWYPTATSKLVSMKNDMDALQANISRHIKSIEELRDYVSMYQDETVQTIVNDLVTNIVQGTRKAHTELSEAYRAGTKLSITFRRTYERIQAAAKANGQRGRSKGFTR
jgi:hypothetical protein